MDAKEKNLKKLSRTNVLMNFVKKNKGSWDHQAWEDFCAYLETKKYTPIDIDAVGALLETKKAAYLEKNK
jgi:hypothetical protein